MQEPIELMKKPGLQFRQKPVVLQKVQFAGQTPGIIGGVTTGGVMTGLQAPFVFKRNPLAQDKQNPVELH